MLLRNVSAGGRRPGAGIAARWTTRVEAREGLGGLPVVGEVGEQALAVRRAVVLRVDVEDVVAVLAQVAHDPPARLAAAARDDDPHVPPSMARS